MKEIVVKIKTPITETHLVKLAAAIEAVAKINILDQFVEVKIKD